MSDETTVCRVRLACYECSTDDKDGITAEELDQCAAEGWTGISEVQSYEESIKVYDDPDEAPPGYSVLDWYTHVGYCPECNPDAADIEAARKALAEIRRDGTVSLDVVKDELGL